jgi:hypothetical protein
MKGSRKLSARTITRKANMKISELKTTNYLAG